MCGALNFLKMRIGDYASVYYSQTVSFVEHIVTFIKIHESTSFAIIPSKLSDYMWIELSS